jgi:hypothetical protein
MKTKCILLSTLALFALTLNVASAANGDLTNDDKGETLTFDDATTNAAFEFAPSNGVYLIGNTTDNAFAVMAFHDNVIGNKAGMAYGMASDINRMYYVSLDPTKETKADVVSTYGIGDDKLKAEDAFPDSADWIAL